MLHVVSIVCTHRVALLSWYYDNEIAHQQHTTQQTTVRATSRAISHRESRALVIYIHTTTYTPQAHTEHISVVHKYERNAKNTRASQTTTCCIYITDNIVVVVVFVLRYAAQPRRCCARSTCKHSQPENMCNLTECV